jgi:hypothetical protein
MWLHIDYMESYIQLRGCIMVAVNSIAKATKVKLTVGRIADFTSDEGRAQSFMWCSDVKGLAVRATANGAMSYVFQSKVKGKSMRITIGDVSVWSIAAAQAEARRLQTVIDNGDHPRQVKADKAAAQVAAIQAKEAEAAALIAKQARESVTVGEVWIEYSEARKSKWGEHTLYKHNRAMQKAGQPQKRGKELTVSGELESLAHVRLVDLTSEHVEEWARAEVLIRASSARLALKMLSVFLNWCALHHDYKLIVSSNAAVSKQAREILGKAKVKNDALEKEQLPTWFAAVQEIGNPVCSAYL